MSELFSAGYIYLDDTYSNNRADHDKHLNWNCINLQRQELRCPLKKYKLGSGTLDYLGYKIMTNTDEAQEKHVL